MKGRSIEIDKIFQFVFLLGTVPFFTLAGDAFAQWPGYEWGHGPGMMGWGYGMGWFTITMAAFWIINAGWEPWHHPWRFSPGDT